MIKITVHSKETKMRDILSLNTSSLKNPFCKKMSQDKNNICSSCYSNIYSKLRPNLENILQENSRLLSKKYNDKIIFNASIVRLSSFGELINRVHFENLIKICNDNPKASFTLWSRRKPIINHVFVSMEKPDNLILIYSEKKKNPKTLNKLPKHFDKVFNVYTKKYAIENNIDINCGKKICIKCMICYSKNNTRVINGLKK